MKVALTLLIVCLAVGIFLIGTGREDLISRTLSRNTKSSGSQSPNGDRTPSPEEKWEDYLSLQRKIGYTVVDVSQSQRWIEEHRNEISIPDKIDFLGHHVVTELNFLKCGIFITIDHNGKHRVVAREWPCNPSSNEVYNLPGFLSIEESRIWLKNNYYQVQRSTEGNGYIITCNYYDPGPPSTRYDTRTEISGRGTASISGPTSALVTIDAQGQLRVAPSGTQQ